MNTRINGMFRKWSFGVLLMLLLAQGPLWGWSAPIRIAEKDGVEHKKPEAGFTPGGKIYVVYEAGAQIHLSSYNGSSVAYERKISDSNLLCYEPAMWINKAGTIHIAWIECSNYNANTQYVKYRYLNGSSWSAVSTLKALDISGTLPGGFVSRKVEDLRIAADESNHVFLVYMIQPAARCQYISKFGSAVTLEGWPMSGRSKHPDVAVDASNIHITWQQLWDGHYTIGYCRRPNSSSGRWQTVIDVRDGIHRPRIAVDSNRAPHVFYQDDYAESRNSIYKYWTGSGFSKKYIVSDDAPRNYSNLDIAVYTSDNLFTMELSASQIYYNWKHNGSWGGHERLPNALSRPDFTSAALSQDGTTALIAYANASNSIYIHTDSAGGTAPPPPPTNIPPTAKFTFSPTSGLYPLAVAFNAGASADSDGQIVSYSWNFGDQNRGSGVAPQHIYAGKGRFVITLTVTDNIGATASATGAVEVLGIAPPLDVVYQQAVNRNLFSIEYLYRVNWKPNPENQAVGATIVAYKIYRRLIGTGDYAYLTQVAAGNQSTYEYLDRTLGREAKQYAYAVSCLDGSGRESDWR